MLMNLVKNWKLIGSMLFVLGAVLFLYFYGTVKFNEGKAHAEAQCNAEKQRAINENLKVRQKQDTVKLLNRSELVDSMLNGTY